MNSTFFRPVTWIGALALALAAPASARADDHELGIETPRLTTDPSGAWGFTGGGQMTGKELGDMIEKEIGAGNYQLVTTILNTCHSGADIATVKGALSGSHNIITPCKGGQTTRVRTTKDGKQEGFLPAFFESVSNDPTKSVDDHIEEGKKGEPRLPKTTADEEKEKKRYERYVQYVKNRNKQREKEGKPPLKVPPPWDQGGREKRIQEPQNDQSADKPGSKKLASGTKSNHAIIYRTDGRKSSAEEHKATEKALKDAGYNTIDSLTPMNQADSQELTKAQNENRQPNLRNDLALPSNLEKTLKNLKAKMDKDEHLTVIVIGHGTVVKSSAKTQAAAGLGAGAVFSQGNNSDHIGDHATASLLGEEVFASLSGTTLIDDYIYHRWAQPALIVQTIDEFSVDGQPVGVRLNGIPIGEMVLDDDPPGGFGFHSLAIDDYAIEAILDTTDILNGLDVSFDFTSSEDYFQLATADDLALLDGGMGYEGMLLRFNLDGDSAPVPAPATLLLFGFGLAVLATARRRRFRP